MRTSCIDCSIILVGTAYILQQCHAPLVYACPNVRAIVLVMFPDTHFTYTLLYTEGKHFHLFELVDKNNLFAALLSVTV